MPAAASTPAAAAPPPRPPQPTVPRRGGAGAAAARCRRRVDRGAPPPGRGGRVTFARRASAVGAVAAVVALTLGGVQHPRPSLNPTPPTAPPRRPRLFLDTYVDAGRVVRTDQGGDTVSEGQAYGLLLAVGRRRPVALRQHLGVDDHPLAARRRPAGVAMEGRRGRRRAARLGRRPRRGARPGARGRRLRSRRPPRSGRGPGCGRPRRDDDPRPRSAASCSRGRGDGIPPAYKPSYASPAAFDVLSRASGDSGGKNWPRVAQR